MELQLLTALILSTDVT